MTYYELWDIPSGSLIGSFDAEQEALAVVRELLAVNDLSYAEDIALGRTDATGKKQAVAEGPALAHRALAAVVRSPAFRLPTSAKRDSTMKSERLSRWRRRAETAESVCAEAYQLAGAVGASVEALDNLRAAAAGEPLPHESFLPVLTEDIAALRERDEWRKRAEHAGRELEGLRLKLNQLRSAFEEAIAH